MNQNAKRDSLLSEHFTYYHNLPRQRLFLPPGAVVVATEPTDFLTILGSCVSICLYDKQRGVGGMNHYLLPVTPTESEFNIRYGDAAYDVLLRDMLRAGAVRHTLVASVFGGARVVPGLRYNDGVSVGQKNWESALQRLQVDGIPVVQKDVGGMHARKVTFNTETGECFVHANPTAIE